MNTYDIFPGRTLLVDTSDATLDVDDLLGTHILIQVDAAAAGWLWYGYDAAVAAGAFDSTAASCPRGLAPGSSVLVRKRDVSTLHLITDAGTAKVTVHGAEPRR